MTDTTKPDTIDEALYDYGTQFISHPASRGIHDIEEAGTIMLAARGSLLRLHAENEALHAAIRKLHAAKGRYHTQLAKREPLTDDARAVLRRIDSELEAVGHIAYTDVWKTRAALLTAVRHFLAVSTGHLPEWLLQPAQAMRQATEAAMGAAAPEPDHFVDASKMAPLTDEPVTEQKPVGTVKSISGPNYENGLTVVFVHTDMNSTLKTGDPLYTAPQPAKPAEQESDAVKAAWMAGYTEGQKEAWAEQPAEQEQLKWADKAMELAVDFGVESLRVGSYERKDAILNRGRCSFETTTLRDKREAARERLRQHLYTAPQPAIPPGHKLVPVEPTPEQLARTLNPPLSRDIYCAMVDTAPKAPQPAKRKPLTDEELRDALRSCPHDAVENLRVRWLYAKDFARAIIAAYERKNGIGGEA